MRRIKWIVIVLTCACFVPFTALAGDFDGSKPLVCAAMETLVCDRGDGCVQGTAESIDLPQFLKIDFKNKSISGKAQDGHTRTTQIKNMEPAEGKLILQGAQRGMGWTMTIKEKGGRMALSSAGERGVFVVFGACTPD